MGRKELSSAPAEALSLAPGFKNGDHNDSRQCSDVKEDANEQQGTIGEVERIGEGLETLSSSQRDEMLVPADGYEVYSDTENTDDLFGVNPVKPYQPPLGQRSKENTSE